MRAASVMRSRIDDFGDLAVAMIAKLSTQIVTPLLLPLQTFREGRHYVRVRSCKPRQP
jgi:hypothetical protein